MNQITSVLNELEDDVIDHPINHVTPTLESARKNVITQNKVYVQQGGHFLESTPERLTDAIIGNDNPTAASLWKQSSSIPQNNIDIAILFQSKSHIVSNLCYGLLGGISLMQLILTHTLIKGSKHEFVSFIQLYSKFGLVPSASFSILTTICLIFALDRIDLLNTREQMKNGVHTPLSNWIILILYTCMFVLSVLCFKFDEIIAMYPASKNEISASEDLWIWKTFNLWKYIFGIAGWFIICISRPQDSLKLHLCSLQKLSTSENQNSN